MMDQCNLKSVCKLLVSNCCVSEEFPFLSRVNCVNSSIIFRTFDANRKIRKARDALKNLFMVKRTREFFINNTINKRHKHGGMLATAPCCHVVVKDT